jgi:hypothetical protein
MGLTRSKRRYSRKQRGGKQIDDCDEPGLTWQKTLAVVDVMHDRKHTNGSNVKIATDFLALCAKYAFLDKAIIDGKPIYDERKFLEWTKTQEAVIDNWEDRQKRTTVVRLPTRVDLENKRNPFIQLTPLVENKHVAFTIDSGGNTYKFIEGSHANIGPGSVLDQADKTLKDAFAYVPTGDYQYVIDLCEYGYGDKYLLLWIKEFLGEELNCSFITSDGEEIPATFTAASAFQAIAASTRKPINETDTTKGAGLFSSNLAIHAIDEAAELVPANKPRVCDFAVGKYTGDTSLTIQNSKFVKILGKRVLNPMIYKISEYERGNSFLDKFKKATDKAARKELVASRITVGAEESKGGEEQEHPKIKLSTNTVLEDIDIKVRVVSTVDSLLHSRNIVKGVDSVHVQRSSQKHVIGGADGGEPTILTVDTSIYEYVPGIFEGGVAAPAETLQARLERCVILEEVINKNKAAVANAYETLIRDFTSLGDDIIASTLQQEAGETRLRRASAAISRAPKLVLQYNLNQSRPPPSLTDVKSRFETIIAMLGKLKESCDAHFDAEMQNAGALKTELGTREPDTVNDCISALTIEAGRVSGRSKSLLPGRVKRIVSSDGLKFSVVDMSFGNIVKTPVLRLVDYLTEDSYEFSDAASAILGAAATAPAREASAAVVQAREDVELANQRAADAAAAAAAASGGLEAWMQANREAARAEARLEDATKADAASGNKRPRMFEELDISVDGEPIKKDESRIARWTGSLFSAFASRCEFGIKKARQTLNQAAEYFNRINICIDPELFSEMQDDEDDDDEEENVFTKNDDDAVAQAAVKALAPEAPAESVREAAAAAAEVAADAASATDKEAQAWGAPSLEDKRKAEAIEAQVMSGAGITQTGGAKESISVPYSAMLVNRFLAGVLLDESASYKVIEPSWMVALKEPAQAVSGQLEETATLGMETPSDEGYDSMSQISLASPYPKKPRTSAGGQRGLSMKLELDSYSNQPDIYKEYLETYSYLDKLIQTFESSGGAAAQAGEGVVSVVGNLFSAFAAAVAPTSSKRPREDDLTDTTPLRRAAPLTTGGQRVALAKPIIDLENSGEI